MGLLWLKPTCLHVPLTNPLIVSLLYRTKASCFSSIGCFSFMVDSPKNYAKNLLSAHLNQKPLVPYNQFHGSDSQCLCAPTLMTRTYVATCHCLDQSSWYHLLWSPLSSFEAFKESTFLKSTFLKPTHLQMSRTNMWSH